MSRMSAKSAKGLAFLRSMTRCMNGKVMVKKRVRHDEPPFLTEAEAHTEEAVYHVLHGMLRRAETGEK